MKFNQARFFDDHPTLYPWPSLLKRNGFNKLYKPREVKFRQYLDLLNIRKGMRLLDVGCGDGVHLDRIVKTFKVKGFGADVSKKSIERAKKQSSKNIKYFVGSAINLPFNNNYFDRVVSFDTLEHIEKQKKAISEMARVLKPGGKLLIYTINKNQKYTWNWCLSKLGMDIYNSWAHDRNLFVDPSDIDNQLVSMGCAISKKELFNAFFTLAADEAVMVTLSLINRVEIIRKSSIFAVIFVNIADILSRLSTPILEILDKPWIAKGYSNSFFIIAKKKT